MSATPHPLGLLSLLQAESPQRWEGPPRDSKEAAPAGYSTKDIPPDDHDLLNMMSLQPGPYPVRRAAPRCPSPLGRAAPRDPAWERGSPEAREDCSALPASPPLVLSGHAASLTPY
jgi:hypothetical protein